MQVLTGALLVKLKLYLHTQSDIVDSRTHVCWPLYRAVSSHNPRCVLEGSAAP